LRLDRGTRHALATGRRLAAEVLRRRSGALKRRAAVIRKISPSRLRPAAPAISGKLAKALASNAGVLVAEGDSWFDYHWHDVLSELEDGHGFDVRSVAHKGDRVEDMAYSSGQLNDFTRLIDKLLSQGVVPRAILLSGGGNDLAGDEFGMLLNNASSPNPGVNDQVAAGVIDVRLYNSYTTILSAVTHVCTARLLRALPILVHGYDYPVPDGRGFLGGWGPLPGPWLEPGFREKGFSTIPPRIAEMRKLIDRFNAMVAALPSIAGFGHVRFVDVRGTLSTGSNYKKWWANELHPTPDGFARIADKFAAKVP
jgi:hypothetical protein